MVPGHARAGVTFDEARDEAAEAAAGSDGLLFLPYLTGERTPYPDRSPAERSSDSPSPTRAAHLTRAVLEGVAFGLRDSLELVRGVGLAPSTEIRATGGRDPERPVASAPRGQCSTPGIVTTSTAEGQAGRGHARRGGGRPGSRRVEDACHAFVQVDDPTEPSGARLQTRRTRGTGTSTRRLHRLPRDAGGLSASAPRGLGHGPHRDLEDAVVPRPA